MLRQAVVLKHYSRYTYKGATFLRNVPVYVEKKVYDEIMTHRNDKDVLIFEPYKDSAVNDDANGVRTRRGRRTQAAVEPVVVSEEADIEIKPVITAVDADIDSAASVEKVMASSGDVGVE